MITIQDLQQLDINKINTPSLKKEIELTLEDYKGTQDKEFFIEEFQPIMDSLWELLQEHEAQLFENSKGKSPCSDQKEAIPKPKAVLKKERTPSKAPKKKTPKKEKTKTKEDAYEMNEELKKCDRELKAFRAERRKVLPQKPPPTRYAKIRKHIIAIGKLIPNGLKNKPEAQKKNKKTLMRFHREILENFEMTSLREIDRGKKQIEEGFKKIEEKLDT
ncbi:hypothetical protein [Aquimarina pacifica]|uniref:hypothetical protein n=1 Tax=Aquimarina pacifica TaxID=1296415 RepID=UPI000471F417|nr:hypothetical protein [Aquimarina pacifica]